MSGLNRPKNSEAGQSLVEFTFVLIVLLLLVSFVLDIGRAFFTLVAIENGAGEGAVYASVHPTWVTTSDAQAGGSFDPTIENIEYRATHESPAGLVDWTKANISVITSTLESGFPITVSVTYSYTVMTPLVNSMVPNGNLPLQAQATQMILRTDPE